MKTLSRALSGAAVLAALAAHADSAPLPGNLQQCNLTVSHSDNPVIYELVQETKRIHDGICKTLYSDAKIHNLQAVAPDLVSGGGLHLTYGNIAPGSGAALGAAFNMGWIESDGMEARTSTSFEARKALTGDSWEAGVKFDALLQRFQRSGAFRAPEVVVTVTHQWLAELSYYGIGNDTRLDGEALYALHRTKVDLDGMVPLPHALAVRARIGFSDWVPVPGRGKLPTIGSVYSESTAPGLSRRASYLAATAAVGWSYPESPRAFLVPTVNLEVAYTRHQAIDGGNDSFHQFNAMGNVTWTPDQRNLLGTFFAQVEYVASAADAGGIIPFYLQPTLGGSDLDNHELMWSFRDYRFRAPNLLAASLSWDHVLLEPFIGIIAFAELGRVADRRSDLLDTGGLKHSWGGGLTLRAGGSAIAHLVYGWGNEGSQFHYAMNSNLAALNYQGQTVSFGLSGVF